MKVITALTCFLTAAAAWAASDVPAPAQDGEAMVVTVTADDGGQVTKNVQVVRVGADAAAVADDADAPATILVRAIADGAADDQEIRVLTKVAAIGDPNRGWLGVALSQQTESEDGQDVTTGVVVSNIVKGSPAEAAGLQKDDVITAINGTSVTDAAAVSQMIGELGPGGEARLTVLRGGQPLEIVVTLSAPKDGSIEWLHTPDLTLRERIRMHPRIGMFTPQGNMKFFDMPSPPDIDSLPGAIARFFDQNGTSITMSVENGESVVKLSRNDNGNVIEITREGDGPIVVKRYTEGSDDVTENEYADGNALAAADPEAAELFNQLEERSASVWMGRNGDLFTFKLDHDFAWVPDNLHEKIAEDLADAGVSAEALESIHESLKSALESGAFPYGPHAGHAALLGKATRTFKVAPDGQIEMTIRKGDSEVVRLFTNEADLQARDPEAFERYQEVMNAELEE